MFRERGNYIGVGKGVGVAHCEYIIDTSLWVYNISFSWNFLDGLVRGVALSRDNVFFF